MFRKLFLASMLVMAVLAVAVGSAAAATGHSSIANGGAAGTTAANAYTGTLTGADDAATNAVIVTPVGNITCANSAFAAQVTSNGGAPFPIGGTGPAGNIASITLSTPANPNGYCSTTISTLGNPYADLSGVDTNGATAGLWDFRGDWNFGAPIITLPLVSVVVQYHSTTSPYSVFLTCRYTGFYNTTINNLAHTMTRRGTLTNNPRTPPCPATLDWSDTIHFYTTISTSFLYLTA